MCGICVIVFGSGKNGGMHCWILMLFIFAALRLGQFVDRLLYSHIASERKCEQWASVFDPPLPSRQTSVKIGSLRWPAISFYWHTALETHQYLNNILTASCVGSLIVGCFVCLRGVVLGCMDWLILNVKADNESLGGPEFGIPCRPFRCWTVWWLRSLHVGF